METLGVYWSIYGDDSLIVAALFIGIAVGWQLKKASDRRKMLGRLKREPNGRFSKKASNPHRQTWQPDEAK